MHVEIRPNSGVAIYVDKGLTMLIERARAGDSAARDELIVKVYDELKAMAKSRMRKSGSDETLQPTALVNEVYLRALGDVGSFENRAHFFFVAARAMHDIVVEQARKKAALRRGGDLVRVPLEDLDLATDTPGEDILALSRALDQLEVKYPRQHKVVMLRFFGGLTNAEAAEVLEINPRTVDRDWRFVKVFLHSAIKSELVVDD